MTENPYQSPRSSVGPQQEENGSKATERRPAVAAGIYAGFGFLAVFMFLMMALLPPDPQTPIAFIEISCCAVPFGISVMVIAASVNSLRQQRGNRIIAFVMLLVASMLALGIVGLLLAGVVMLVKR